MKNYTARQHIPSNFRGIDGMYYSCEDVGNWKLIPSEYVNMSRCEKCGSEVAYQEVTHWFSPGPPGCNSLVLDNRSYDDY